MDIQNQSFVQGYVQGSDLDNPRFSLEVIGRIALLIVNHIPKAQVLRAMPGYTPLTHESYATYYDQLKAALHSTTQQV